jgi:hypothetical protein
VAGQVRVVAVALVTLAGGLAGCIGGDGEVSLQQLEADAGLLVDVSPESGDIDTTFTFDATGTPSADQLTFAWDFGDGGNATGDVVEHSFAYDHNTYQVEVTASNGSAELTGTIPVEVGSGENSDPTVTVDADEPWVGHGEPVTVTASADDPDGEPVNVTWLLAEKQEQGGHSHGDGGGGHGHGGGGEDADPYGIPAETGTTGPEASFTFEESGTYKLVAQAEDPKDGSARDHVTVKVTRTVPKPTFTFQKSEELMAGTGAGTTGTSLSEVLYDAQEPSQNTYVDAAVYETRLVYPGSGTFSLDWSNATVPADLEAELVNEGGDRVASLTAEDPTADRLESEVDLDKGSYTIAVRANAGASVPYTVTLDLDLEIPGLTDVDEGHGDGHGGHDH